MFKFKGFGGECCHFVLIISVRSMFEVVLHSYCIGRDDNDGVEVSTGLSIWLGHGGHISPNITIVPLSRCSRTRTPVISGRGGNFMSLNCNPAAGFSSD